MSRKLATIAVAACLILTVIPASAAIAPVKVLDTTNIRWEYSPFSDGTYLAYGSSLPNNDGAAVALLREVATGATQRMNPPRTYGWPGGFDPTDDKVILQIANRRRSNSDIFLWDVGDAARTPMSALNSQLWEWDPRISATQVSLFRNYVRAGKWRTGVFLYNRSTGGTRRIAEYPESTTMANGSVGDAYATWGVCTRRTCKVYVHDIAAHATVALHSAGGRPQYAPAIDEATGTLFFVRSGFGCGKTVGVWSVSVTALGGARTLVSSLPQGSDADWASLSPSLDVSGGTDYLFTRFDCRRGRQSIWRVPSVIT